jgi:hypothetical protein
MPHEGAGLATRELSGRSDDVAVNSALTGLLHIPHGEGLEDALAFDLNLDIIAVVYK